ncbi:MAG: prepilin-type N-terminal cleavage/methylation domain-containing protein [Solidesulfovibrio sp. DCME]|uniref:prepilin-type N-terminal cleavage/methylation domain-containing protein n=1 Tax=Solidesulfovibrio sp. DCME TaxID=3447380 RepID=UPI003D0D4A65
MNGSDTNRSAKEAGFSLLELVCVLVLLGIVVMLSTRVFSNMIRGYTLARNSDAAVQKAQNAMQRLTIDFTYLDTSLSSGTSSTITYNTTLNNTVQVIVFQSGNQILYKYGGTNYVLTDGVKASTLAFNYYTAYNSGALSSFNSTANVPSLIGFSYTMVGDDASQNLSQNYSTRVKVNKVGY